MNNSTINEPKQKQLNTNNLNNSTQNKVNDNDTFYESLHHLFLHLAQAKRSTLLGQIIINCIFVNPRHRSKLVERQAHIKAHRYEAITNTHPHNLLYGIPNKSLRI